jgi:hypothetical protein
MVDHAGGCEIEIQEPEACYEGTWLPPHLLEALAAHYNIGKRPDVRDVVGVLSSHPFTICAVLRVFGQGIEHSSLRRDSGFGAVHVSGPMLERSQCAALLKSAPVERVRTAKMHAETSSAFTGFYVEHTEPERARQEVCAKVGGSEGYFRELQEGHEYLCVVNSGRVTEPGVRSIESEE